MPVSPHNQKCASLGCKDNRSKLSTFCIKHGGRDTYVAKKTIERKSFNSMYDSSSWKKLRKAKLSAQPICQACLGSGIISPASMVDHLFSWSAIGKDAFYRNVFQCLCASCHAEKTQLERDGIYRHYTVPVTDYQLSDYQSAMGIASVDSANEVGATHGLGEILKT